MPPSWPTFERYLPHGIALAAEQLLGHLLVMFICQAHLSVRHQKSLDPVMVPPLADPIGDRSSLLRHLEPLAEGLGEPLQSRAWKAPNGGEDLLDGAWIERVQAWIRLLLRRRLGLLPGSRLCGPASGGGDWGRSG